MDPSWEDCLGIFLYSSQAALAEDMTLAIMDSNPSGNRSGTMGGSMGGRSLGELGAEDWRGPGNIHSPLPTGFTLPVLINSLISTIQSQ